MFDIISYLEANNFKNIRDLGENVRTTCPWPENHDKGLGDAHPSFSIQKNYPWKFYCFGCHESGNIWTLARRLELTGELPSGGSGKTLKPDTFLQEFLNNDFTDIFIDEKKADTKTDKVVFMPFHLTEELPKHVLDYLIRKRQLTEDIIKERQIRYCSAGYYRKRIIIPIFDVDSRYKFFCAHRIDGKQEDKYLYPSGVEKCLFNGYKAKLYKKYVIVVEGIFDVLTLERFGYNAVSVLGGIVLSNQVPILLKYWDDIILCMDSDLPGKLGQAKSESRVSNHGVNFSRITLPNNLKDPDSCTSEEFIEFFNQRIQSGALIPDLNG